MFALFCGLLAIGSVFGGNEKLDYRGMKGPKEIENNIDWTPPEAATRWNQESSDEHGVTPGRRPTTCECGKANKFGGRIVGGKEIAPNEYPFLVGVSSGSSPFSPHCGGTIISPRHVVTAAHCTEGETSLCVTIGEHDRYDLPKIIRVRRFMDHEGYNPDSVQNDISLLFLEEPIKMTRTIGVACLPKPGTNLLVGETVRIVGWGAQRYDGPMTDLPSKVDVQVVDINSCARAWPYNVRPSPPSQICTHAVRKTACQGDSGGPVIWLDPDTNRYTLVGAVSFGPFCKDHKPSVQSSVIHHLSWITRKIKLTAPEVQTCSKV